MSTKTSQMVDELSTALVEKSRQRRHPALLRRDALYAVSESFARLTERGKEVISNVPHAIDLAGLRPLTMEEQIARFSGHGISDWSLVPDIEEDDWQDIYDDLDEDGITPHELAALQNQERYFARGLKAKEPSSPKSATPPPRQAEEPSGDDVAPATQGPGASAPGA